MLGQQVATTNVVTALTADKVLEIQSVGGILEFKVNYQLSPANGFTNVICTSTVSSDSSIFPYAATLLKSTARSLLKSDLKALKLVAERETVKG